MPRTDPVIRLVGGPRPLDGSTYDLSCNHHDRADVDGDRFVRAIRGTTVMSLAALRERCSDRETAEELAEQWACAVFAYGRDRRLRTRYFRFQATHRLTPVRDDHGRWSLVIGAPATTPAGRRSIEQPADRPSDRPAGQPSRSVWAVLEAAVDEAATRFTTVAALLPDGPLAERAASTRRAVGSCVTDAARLCGVGTAVAPEWQPGCDHGRAEQLAARVAALIGTIEEATAHLVDLHLEIGDGGDPVEPLAHLRNAWTALDPSS